MTHNLKRQMLDKLQIIKQRFDEVSDLIIQQSLVRTENRGGFVKVIGGGI